LNAGEWDCSSFPEFSQVVHIISANPDHFVYSGKLENSYTPRTVSHLLVSKEDSRPQPGPACSDLFVLVAVQIQATNWKKGGRMAFEVFAHLTVRPGQLEGFQKQAAECIRITKEKDTQTLRYDWFLTKDGTECEVHEAYAGPEGLIEHNRNILEARNRLFRDYADNHFMTVYGEASQPLLDLFKAHSVGFKWYSFMQGLEQSAASPPRTADAAGARSQ
jgi:hypothetical protein